MTDITPDSDDIIIYGDGLPNPDLDTETWHTVSQAIYVMLVGGPWRDLEQNARASLEDHPDNTEVVEIASLLLTLQEMIVDEYKGAGKGGLGELEKIRNVVARLGPIGTLRLYLVE